MITVNLIPESILIAQMRRRHVRRWLVVGIASLALLAVPLVLESYRAARAESLELEWQQVKQERNALQGELATIAASSHETYLQMERAKALRSKRSWSAMLGLIASAMPEGCWLLEFATDPAAPTGGSSGGRTVTAGSTARAETAASKSPVEKKTVTIEAPRTIRLIGYAADSSEPLVFVSRLKETGVFNNVTLERSQREPVADGVYFRFEMTCGW